MTKNLVLADVVTKTFLLFSHRRGICLCFDALADRPPFLVAHDYDLASCTLACEQDSVPQTGTLSPGRTKDCPANRVSP
jgi:hypothetical protein